MNLNVKFKDLMMFLIGFLFLCLGLVWLMDETSFFYQEPVFKENDEDAVVFDEKASEVFYTNKDSDTLVILVHGFPASPYEWKYIGAKLSNNFNVFIPRLYGFGTDASNFVNTYYSQWYGSLRDKYDRVRPNYKKVYVCGISMGGLLTMHLALDTTNNMDKLVLVAAPAFLNKISEGVLFDYRLYLSYFIGAFSPTLVSAPDTADQDGADWVGYDGLIYTKQVHSMKINMNIVRKYIKYIKVPVLIIQAKSDRSVPFENLDYIYKNIGSEEKFKKVYNLDKWEHSKHLLTLYGSTRDMLYEDIYDFLKE